MFLFSWLFGESRFSFNKNTTMSEVILPPADIDESIRLLCACLEAAQLFGYHVRAIVRGRGSSEQVRQLGSTYQYAESTLVYPSRLVVQGPDSMEPMLLNRAMFFKAVLEFGDLWTGFANVLEMSDAYANARQTEWVVKEALNSLFQLAINPKSSIDTIA